MFQWPRTGHPSRAGLVPFPWVLLSLEPWPRHRGGGEELRVPPSRSPLLMRETGLHPHPMVQEVKEAGLRRQTMSTHLVPHSGGCITGGQSPTSNLASKGAYSPHLCKAAPAHHCRGPHGNTETEVTVRRTPAA